MTLSVKVDETVTPATLTVTSDRRKGTVTVVGETASYLLGVHITDPGVTWTPVSDDGVTAVYHLG